MKRYLLFAGMDAYPAGGWKDLKSQSDDKLELIQFYVDNRYDECWDWMHIVDTKHGNTIATHTTIGI